MTTLIYELIGPIITKIALIKAGEIIIGKKKTQGIINKSIMWHYFVPGKIL
ncbi:MAG: hypothetical protein PHY83_01440 [Bacilli bacterium]|nr:hypothetical protein [Bacilli bacterium]